jgi:hypothetical protein
LLSALALTVGIAAILLWYLAFRELDEEEPEETSVPVAIVLSPSDVPTQAPSRTATASRTPLPSFTPSLTALPIPTPQINPIPLSGLYAGQTITFSGQAQPGDIIIILDQGDALAQTLADETGEWVIQFEEGLPEGVYALQVVAENTDGERSEAAPVRLLVEQLPSPTSTFTLLPSPTITISPSPTVTATQTLTASPTTTITLTDTPLPTDTSTPVSTETIIPSDTPLPSTTSEPTEVSIVVVTLTETMTLAPSLTDIPSETPTPFPTDTATLTIEPTSTLTLVPTSTLTEIPSETPTALPSETLLPLPQPTDTVIPSPSPTDIPTEAPTLTPSPTSTPTSTETSTPTSTSSPTDTPTLTATATATATLTSTSTPTLENTEVAQIASETPTIEAPLIEILTPSDGEVVMAGAISIRGRGPASVNIQIIDDESDEILAETTTTTGGQWSVNLTIEEARDVVLIAQLSDDPTIQSPAITITIAPIVQPRTGIDLTPDPENERGAAFTALLALLITAVGFTLIYAGRLLYAIAIRYDDSNESTE